MHHTYQSHGHADALEVTITWDRKQPTHKYLQISCHQQMSQPTRNVESSNMWRCLRTKHNSGDCSKMVKQLYPYSSHSMNLVFPNHQPQSKHTTPRPNALFLLQLDKNSQVNGHVILLNEGQGKTKRIFRLLETMKPKHGGLFTKNHPTHQYR